MKPHADGKARVRLPNRIKRLERPRSSLDAYSTGTATLKAKDASTRARTVSVLINCMELEVRSRFSHELLLPRASGAFFRP